MDQYNLLPNKTRIKGFGMDLSVPNFVGTIETSFIHNGSVYYMVALDGEYQGFINSNAARKNENARSFVSHLIVHSGGGIRLA